MTKPAVMENRPKMGRKKGTRKTVLIRVYEESATAINDAASESKLSVAEFFEAHALPCVDRARRENIEQIQAAIKKQRGNKPQP